MNSAHPNLRHAQFASAFGVVGARRDRWGRFQFAPPALPSPRNIFDPQLFRDQPLLRWTGKRPQSVT